MPGNIQSVCLDYKHIGRHLIHIPSNFHMWKNSGSNVAISDFMCVFLAHKSMLQFRLVALERKNLEMVYLTGWQDARTLSWQQSKCDAPIYIMPYNTKSMYWALFLHCWRTSNLCLVRLLSSAYARLFNMPAKGWKCLFFQSSVHRVQSSWGSFGFPPARNPFQIQWGVAAMTPLVAPKDCNRRPQIWVTQLSRCARLMYRELWQCNPRPWRHRWKRWRRRWWDGSQRGKDATVSCCSAEPPSFFLFFFSLYI